MNRRGLLQFVTAIAGTTLAPWQARALEALENAPQGQAARLVMDSPRARNGMLSSAQLRAEFQEALNRVFAEEYSKMPDDYSRIFGPVDA